MVLLGENNIGSGLKMLILKERGGEKGFRILFKERMKLLKVVVNIEEDIISSVKCSRKT